MRPKGVNDFQVTWAIRDIPKSLVTSTNELCLLFLFGSIIGNKDYCWYNLDQLSDLSRMCRTTLKKCLKSLEQKNLIIINRPQRNGRGISNEYTLNYKVILNLSQKPVDNSEQKGSSDDCFMAKGVATRPQKGSPDALQERGKERHKEKRDAKPSFFSSTQKPQARANTTASPKKTELKSLVPWWNNVEYETRSDKPSPLLEPEPKMRLVKSKVSPHPLQDIISSLSGKRKEILQPERGAKEKEALEELRMSLYGK